MSIMYIVSCCFTLLFDYCNSLHHNTWLTAQCMAVVDKLSDKLVVCATSQLSMKSSRQCALFESETKNRQSASLSTTCCSDLGPADSSSFSLSFLSSSLFPSSPAFASTPVFLCFCFACSFSSLAHHLCSGALIPGGCEGPECAIHPALSGLNHMPCVLLLVGIPGHSSRSSPCLSSPCLPFPCLASPRLSSSLPVSPLGPLRGPAAAVQVQGWCHAMCLNRTRQRRRHRRGMEDWANLLEHALNADASPTFQHWLRHRSAWQWQPPEHQADHPEEALVGPPAEPPAYTYYPLLIFVIPCL